MHILDWLDGGTFVPSINEMLRPTGFFVPQSAQRMPTGWDDPTEARLGKECGALLDTSLNTALLNWWLSVTAGANVPNWDLACASRTCGDREGIVLVEAKAHVRELSDAGKQPGNEANDARIRAAIKEAGEALGGPAAGINLTADSHYQFANRIAFAWKLASEGIPAVLMYIGFTENRGISAEPLKDGDHWQRTVLDATREALPQSFWEREIDCGKAPLWLVTRSQPCIRQSPNRKLG
jgi:hypothetical protein